MTRERLELGARGEKVAARFLKRRGYRILEQNFKTSLGEIDIIAREAKQTVFIEVKSLSDTSYILPQQMVHKTKQVQITKAALCYLKAKGSERADCRFDVLAVTFSGRKRPKMELLKDAFWVDDRYLY